MEEKFANLKLAGHSCAIVKMRPTFSHPDPNPKVEPLPVSMRVLVVLWRVKNYIYVILNFKSEFTFHRAIEVRRCHPSFLHFDRVQAL